MFPVMVALFIDGQNIPYNLYEDILNLAKTKGEILQTFIFANVASSWSKEKIKLFGAILILMDENCDEFLHKQVLGFIREKPKELHSVIIASNDKDFTKTIKIVQEEDMEVLGIGYNNPSKELMQVSDGFCTLLSKERQRQKFLKEAENIEEVVKLKDEVFKNKEIITKLQKENSELKQQINKEIQKYASCKLKETTKELHFEYK